MIDQHVTEHTYTEKPGIGCMTSIMFGKRAILASGGFDHRIKVVSLKTLKQLVLLKFHEGIVNQLHLDMVDQATGAYKLYSCAEDGYVAYWSLKV